MTFEGIPRPAQLNPYAEPLSPYLAANAARSDKAGKPLVKSLGKEEEVKGLRRDQHDNSQPDDEDAQGETFSEEEAEQIRMMARMRGIMDLVLESGVRYEFQVNEATGLVDLVDMATGRVVVQLMPDELMRLSQGMQRYAGMLTDRTG